MAILKVAKPTFDAESANEKDLIFSSNLDYLKEQLSGLIETDNNGDLIITHNLGYVPAFTVFVSDYANQTVWYSYDNFGDLYATSTQIIITGAMTGIKSRIYYSIFSSEL